MVAYEGGQYKLIVPRYEMTEPRDLRQRAVCLPLLSWGGRTGAGRFKI